MAKPVVRLRVVQVAFGLAVVAVVVRAAQVQVVQGAAYRATAQQQRTERVVLPARRGAIYDRNGVPLALTREVYHVGVAPRELLHRGQDARTIATALRLSRQSVDRALEREYAYFGGPYGATQVAPLRTVRGVHLTSELVRFYPSGDFARALIGHPGDEGRPASGLERVLDTLLAGTPGSAVVLRDSHGRRFESPARLRSFPAAGSDVVLTVDAALQDIVERALADALDRYDAQGGDVVVLDPRSGEVLAVASRRADGSTPPTAFTSVFEPGSTAKIFVAAALLQANLASPLDSVYAERGVWVQKYRTIHDDEPEEWLTLRGVIQVSSNIGIVKFVQRLPADAEYQMLRDFGFGAPTGIEFPAESRGTLERPDRWSGISAGQLGMGYEVAVTPLQLAAAYAAIANGGLLLSPTLVREARAPDGTVRFRQGLMPVRRVVRPEVAAELRSMLRGVVYEGGTGSTAALSTYELAGKTGTARRATGRGYVPGAYTATFASLFPAEDPQLVMVVKLDDPQGAYARLTAAPVTRSVIEQVLGSRSSALDAWRLGTRASPLVASPSVGGGSVPFVLSWPLPRDSATSPARLVPNVLGLTLRKAAGSLHRSGFQVRVRGWGTVTSATPQPGTSAAAGTLVTLVAGTIRP